MEHFVQSIDALSFLYYRKTDKFAMETDKSARDESQGSLYSKTAMKAKLPAVKQKASKAK